MGIEHLVLGLVISGLGILLHVEYRLGKLEGLLQSHVAGHIHLTEREEAVGLTD